MRRPLLQAAAPMPIDDEETGPIPGIENIRRQTFRFVSVDADDHQITIQVRADDSRSRSQILTDLANAILAELR